MPTRIPLTIPTLAYPTQCGRGGVVGGEVEDVALAGAGLCHIGTAGGKTENKIYVRKGGDKMPNGFGRGFGFGRGMGFGFRGSSPPWPYIGRGRGGLPRCGYFFAGAAVPPFWPYVQIPPPYYAAQSAPGYPPFAAPMSKEEELNYLKSEAEAIKEELEAIEARVRELESEE